MVEAETFSVDVMLLTCNAEQHMAFMSVLNFFPETNTVKC